MTAAVDFVGEKFLVDKALLEKNSSNKHNVVIFYQGNIANNANYPTIASIFLLYDIKQILNLTKGQAYLFYHEPDVIADVYADSNYKSQEGKQAYYNQIDYLTKLSEKLFGFKLTSRSMQDYVENEMQIQKLYAAIKEDRPLDSNIIEYLGALSKPARASILKRVFGSKLKARHAESVVFLDNATNEKRTEYTQKLYDNLQLVLDSPQFEKYSMYELLTTIGTVFTHNAFLRPNQGANKLMQEEAQRLSERYAKSIFNQDGMYVPVYGLKNLNVLFSFIHPLKKEAGVEVRFARANELKDLEKIIQVSGIDKTKYLQDLRAQFPEFENVISLVRQYNEQNDIENVVPAQIIKTEDVVPKLNIIAANVDIPANIKELISARNELRAKRMFEDADKIRAEIVAKGYYPEDAPISKLNT